MSSIPRPNPAGKFDPAHLFRPASIAVIGAGTEAGATILANLVLGGFRGGLDAVIEPAMLQHAPQLAVIATPPEQVAPSMERLAGLGCFAAIVPGPVTGLQDMARCTGVRVLGANAFGIAVPRQAMNATMAHCPLPAGRLAVVGQSDGLLRTVVDWAEPNGIGFSAVVGLGENADIGFGAVLDFLSRDSGTGVILLDIRDLKHARAFLSAARAAARLRPVIALRNEEGDGGRPGSARVFDAALGRAGVLTVSTLGDWLAAAGTLSRARLARNETLAIVANSAGLADLAGDAAAREGVDVAHRMIAASAGLAAALRAVCATPEPGGVLVLHAPSGADDQQAVTDLAALPAPRLPVLYCATGDATGAHHRRALSGTGGPVFAEPERAVRGFLHLVQQRRNRAMARELPSSAVLPIAPDRELVRQVFAAVRREGRRALMQDEALDVLVAYGIPAIPTRTVATARDAALAASTLGFPAVVKLRQAEPPSARAPAGLVLDLDTEAAVERAAAQVLDRAGAVLVQREAARAREVSIRVFADPVFGPAIAFGAGGTLADPADAAIDLPPLNLPLAHALIARDRTGAHLHRRLRDRPAARVDAVAEALVRVSQLVVDWPEIAEVEIPSLFADPDGVLAVDAWLRLRAPEEPRAPLAIAPYPADLVRHHDLNGERITIRPIRPEDAEAHTAFFSRLSPQDIRYRFFSALRELSAEQTVRLTQIDYDREMAFVAVRDATRETVGVARLVRDPDKPEGEFAVIVQSDMKGRGLASRLMACLIDWARTQGLAEVVGQVLADNAPMLAFVRHLGFTVRRMAEDPDVMEVRLVLEPDAGQPR
ncbi:MAG: GNAT family N-acetyltransferase [Acetobacteraceae bacterium]